MTWLGFQLGISQGQNQGVGRMCSNLDLSPLPGSCRWIAEFSSLLAAG